MATLDDLDPDVRKNIQDRLQRINFGQALAGSVGDASMGGLFDRQRSQAMQPLTDLDTRRKDAMQDEELRGKRLANDSETFKNNLLRDAVDPNSEYSKSVRGYTAQALRGHAALFRDRNPTLSQFFQQTADGLDKSTLPAARVGDVVAPFGDLGKDALSEAHSRAQEKLAEASLAAQREAHSETARHNKVMEGIAGEKADISIDKPQDKVAETGAALENYIDNMKEVLGMLENGDVHPDLLKKTQQGIASHIPNALSGAASAVGLGVDPKYTKFRNIIDQAQVAKERATQGSVKWNPMMAERLKSMLLPEGLNEDQTKERIKSNIYEAQKQLEGVNSRLRMNPKSGEYSDKSLYTQNVQKEAPAQAKTLHDKASGDAPKVSTEMIEKMKEFLRQSPNDPRAPKVRERLKSLGVQ